MITTKSITLALIVVLFAACSKRSDTVFELPRPNSGTFTFAQAEARKSEIYSLAQSGINRPFVPASSLSPRKRVVLLGATGSIGESTLRVIAAHGDKLELVGVAARSNWEKLAAIARQFTVRNVGVYDEPAFAAARVNASAFPPGTQLVGGLGGLTELARLPSADVVLVAVVGTTGLEPALAALAAVRRNEIQARRRSELGRARPR